ncbi:MAG TPA: alpha/beta hydrolase [Actinomycetospora sp.]|uniref:esterase/lipase family protein n=1 Tax=Actinomycetospora sp. TaxID=1872135 RepID=UPI002F3F0A7B
MTRRLAWPDRAPLGGLAPRRRLFVLVVTAVVLAVAALVAVSVGREYAVPPKADPAVMGPVVLVPGFGGNTAALQALALRLRVIGRPAVVVSLPDGGTGDFSGQAAAIDHTVRDLIRHDGARSVDLVGYSAGGVASWLYLQTGTTAPAIRRLVTMGSPLQGADIAAAGGALVPGACPRACQQLAPGSALLTRLDAGPRPDIPWLSLWTDQDDVVTPPDSAALPGVRSIRLQSVCGGILINHGQLPTAGLTDGLALRALGTKPLPVPVPGDCSKLQAEGVGRPVLTGTS